MWLVYFRNCILFEIILLLAYIIFRNTILFECILDYCLTGVLHFPHCICASTVREEMKYWGLTDSKLQVCCYARLK